MLPKTGFLMASCLANATSITAWTDKLINKEALNGVKMILNLNSCNERFPKLSEIMIDIC